MKKKFYLDPKKSYNFQKKASHLHIRNTNVMPSYCKVMLCSYKPWHHFDQNRGPE